jgi:hypothetical protein
MHYLRNLIPQPEQGIIATMSAIEDDRFFFTGQRKGNILKAVVTQKPANVSV